MKRRIDTLIAKNKIVGYDKFVQKLREDKAVFDEFVNYLTINVSEFYRNPEQWKLLDQEIIPELISKFGKNLKNMECCMLYRRRAIFSGYGVIRHIPLNQIKIIATDIDKQVIDKAKTGLYNEKKYRIRTGRFKEKVFLPR